MLRGVNRQCDYYIPVLEFLWNGKNENFSIYAPVDNINTGHSFLCWSKYGYIERINVWSLSKSYNFAIADQNLEHFYIHTHSN